MGKNNVIHLDLTGCKYLGEIHQRIKETFGFPEYYGENWHTFRDAFITVGLPEKIVIHDEHTISKSLAGQIEKMHTKLDEIKSEVNGYGWSFEYELVEDE